LGERLGHSNKGEDCLQREREVCGGFLRFERQLERERGYGKVGRRPVKTLSGINVLAAHAMDRV